MPLFRHLEEYISNHYLTQKSALLLTGARQTGKTYAIRQEGKKFKSFIEINFIEHPELVDLFANVSSAKDILLRISALTTNPLIKDDTLIFFDEVQKCENIVTAIKFLVDEGSYRYALSGSLLGVELKDLRSAPVGYMTIKDVYPLDFEEFALNVGVSPNIIDVLHDNWGNKTAVDEIIHQRMLKLFQLYLVVGGMPAAVDKYIQSNNLNEVARTQTDIVDLYKWDISQYARDRKLVIKEIYDLIPSELDAKNKRFILKQLNQHAKYDRYKDDFLWLKDAGVAIPVYNVTEPMIPLKLSETRNLFKLFSNDVGLLACQYADGIQIKILSGETDMNYGAIYENVVAQELLCHGFQPYYFNSKKLGEIDFIVQSAGRPLPIEVKSGKDYRKHKALDNILNIPTYGIKEGIVLSNANLHTEGDVVYAPVYMLMFIKRTISAGGKYVIDLTGLQ